MIVCDTGPLVAAALTSDEHYRECVDLFAGLQMARQEILVPGPVVAEVGYLLHRAGGAAIEAKFLMSLADGDFTPADLAEEDYGRAAELVQQYSDLRLGTTEACVIALTERLKLPEVATLDRRHSRSCVRRMYVR